MCDTRGSGSLIADFTEGSVTFVGAIFSFLTACALVLSAAWKAREQRIISEAGGIVSPASAL